MERYALKRDQIVLNCSHTHCGPVVGRNLLSMYPLDRTDCQRIDEYTAWLREQIVQVMGDAIEKLAPATLAWGEGRADFAVNRRNNKHADVPRLRASGQLCGPVDHSVPVLRVTDQQYSIRAIVFGYACHPTKLTDFFRWCGDYAGFAQLHVEEAHPGAVAMFWQGCCGDQTPWPRGGSDVQATEAVGRELADAVETVLAGPLFTIEGRLATRYREVELRLGELPPRSELKSLAKGRNRLRARHAGQILETLDAGKTPVESYPGYPVQVWRFGSELLFITLGGEVVVDYAVRLKRKFGVERTWVAGYSNDVMAYIPSRRVLAEGGYEGRTSMVCYDLPTVWAPEIEETIVKEVHALARPTD